MLFLPFNDSVSTNLAFSSKASKSRKVVSNDLGIFVAGFVINLSNLSCQRAREVIDDLLAIAIFVLSWLSCMVVGLLFVLGFFLSHRISQVSKLTYTAIITVNSVMGQ